MSIVVKVKQGENEVLLELVKDEEVLWNSSFKDQNSFEKVINNLVEGCKRALKEGKDAFSNLEKRPSLFKEGGEERDPALIWKRIEALTSEEEVINFFNSLPLEVRQSVARYIMAHVNMFKGKGVIFSQYFNYTTSLLER